MRAFQAIPLLVLLLASSVQAQAWGDSLSARLGRKGPSALNTTITQSSSSTTRLLMRADSLIEVREPGWESVAELLPELSVLSSALSAAQPLSLLLHISDCEADREIVRGALQANVFNATLVATALEQQATQRALNASSPRTSSILSQIAALKTDVRAVMMLLN